MAVDRSNARVAPLYQALHPAVLDAFSQVLDAAHQLGKPVSICGELAGDPRAAPLLVALGFDQLSMNAVSLPVIKHVLGAFSSAELEKLVDNMTAMSSAEEIEQYLDAEFGERNLEPFLRRRSSH